MLLLAPPDSRVPPLITALVRDLGILRLRLATIVQEEVASGSPLGKQAKSYLDSDQELPEQIALPLIAARTNKADAVASGWILEGYPTTRVQALALQSSGVLPTHVLYFTNSSGSPAGEPVEPAIAAQAEHFKRHGAAVQEVFAPVAHFVDLKQSDAAITTQLTTLLNGAPRSRAPKRPMRVLLLGPRGAGRHTQASLLAQKYGLVHVNATALLKAEIKKTPALGLKVQQYLSSGLLVPDDIINPLVLARVLAQDAKTKGFVLEGFPRNSVQAQALARAAVVPNRVVVLNVEEEECKRRVQGRRRDHETGDEYNFTPDAEGAAEEAALPSAIRDRLVHAPNDQLQTLEAINFSYASFIDDLKVTYGKVLREIHGGGRGATASDASKSKLDVFEQIEDFLLAPLHSGYAHVKAKEAAGAGKGEQQQSAAATSGKEKRKSTKQ